MEVRTGRVTGRQTAKNRDGAESVRLLQVVVTDRDDVQTVQLVSQTGEESNPPDGSVVVLVPAGPALKLAVATLDRVTPDLAVGGKRIYSTAEDGVTVMAEARLDPDGKITLSNSGGSIVIQPDGTIVSQNAGTTITQNPGGVINFHGTQAVFDCPVQAPSVALVTAGGGSGSVTADGDINATGTITGQTDVIAGTISGKTHTHPGDSGGTTGAPQ